MGALCASDVPRLWPISANELEAAKTTIIRSNADRLHYYITWL